MMLWSRRNVVLPQKVIDGPFNEFNGIVENVNYEKSLLTEEVLIFGRTTAVELEFSKVEKT